MIDIVIATLIGTSMYSYASIKLDHFADSTIEDLRKNKTFGEDQDMFTQEEVEIFAEHMEENYPEYLQYLLVKIVGRVVMVCSIIIGLIRILF